MLVIIGIGEGKGGVLDQLGTVKSKHILLLLALGFRYDDGGFITAGISHQSQADARVAGRALDDMPAWLQNTAFLCILNDEQCGSILDGASRV